MRYDRQIILPEIGEEGQKKLQEAKVLIVGVGGLGSPIALYLAGAGVGCLGLVDDDLVSITNLQRQVLYSEKELGKPKAICAAERQASQHQPIPFFPPALHQRQSITHQIPAAMFRKQHLQDGCSQTNRQQPQPASQK